MQAPAKPKDEEERLETLRALNILDTIPEERYDRLTRLAKRLFNVPIALVSLVDENRQWFKSSTGIDVKETSREISFCGHAILGDEILEVPDATQDERFYDNPSVTNNPNIRFYAGCPLTMADGSKIGTLCLVDNHPRQLQEEDKMLLRDLAHLVEAEMDAIQLATMDTLTQLSNRRGFEAIAQHAINLCKRLGKPATLLFFDLNDFKKINDQYGHASGDVALQTFSATLMNAFRNSDVIARHGGDEFVVLLTNTLPEVASKVLDRFSGMIADHNLLDNNDYDISYSVGVIEYDSQKHESIVDLISDADQLMYAKKKKLRKENH